MAQYASQIGEKKTTTKQPKLPLQKVAFLVNTFFLFH